MVMAAGCKACKSGRHSVTCALKLKNSDGEIIYIPDILASRFKTWVAKVVDKLVNMLDE